MKLKSFDEWVNEMSIAKPGDWDEGVDFLGDMSEYIASKKWNLLKTFNFGGKTLELRQLRNSLEFMLGNFHTKTINTKSGKEEKVNFLISAKISLTRIKSVEKMEYKRVINVDGVFVTKELRGLGVALNIYKYLVNELHYNILGDENQYFGARKLWSRLSKELDVQVDLIDVETREIVEKNVILHHGNYDNDFDERLWNYKQDKKNVRSILTKIKD